MNLPTLRQLQFLVALGETGSFSKAAKACHVTQPTLSAAIKELEALFGTQLAEREARGARLTQAGAEAVARATALLSDVEDLVRSVSKASLPLTGPFHLGAIPTVAPFILPAIMPDLKAAYPELKLFLHEERTADLVEGLRARRIDAALIALPWDASGIAAEPLFDDEFLFAAPDTHPLAHKNGLSPGDLAEEDLLLLEDGHCLRDHAVAICRPAHGDQQAQFAATSLSTLINMIAGGMGVSLLPRLAADHGLQIPHTVQLRAFTAPLIGRQVGIAWRKGSSREAEARTIGEIVKRVVEASTPV